MCMSRCHLSDTDVKTQLQREPIVGNVFSLVRRKASLGVSDHTSASWLQKKHLSQTKSQVPCL